MFPLGRGRIRNDLGVKEWPQGPVGTVLVRLCPVQPGMHGDINDGGGAGGGSPRSGGTQAEGVTQQ